jgi:hypothetical protein
MFGNSCRLHLAAIASAAAFLHAGIYASQASATSLMVQLACASDYYAYCSKHDPNGKGVRACMSANGSKLSKRCVNALISAGEISKAEVARRSANK